MLPPSLTLFAARVLSKTPHACFEAVPNAPGATAACQAEGSCGLPLGMPEPGRTLATDRATGRIEIGHGRTSADANRVHSVVVDCSKRPLRVELPRSRSGREGPLSAPCRLSPAKPRSTGFAPFRSLADGRPDRPGGWKPNTRVWSPGDEVITRRGAPTASKYSRVNGRISFRLCRILHSGVYAATGRNPPEAENTRQDVEYAIP